MRGRYGNFDIKGGPAKNSRCNQLTINREIISYFNPYDFQGGHKICKGGGGAVAPFRPSLTIVLRAWEIVVPLVSVSNYILEHACASLQKEGY